MARKISGATFDLAAATLSVSRKGERRCRIASRFHECPQTRCEPSYRRNDDVPVWTHGPFEG